MDSKATSDRHPPVARTLALFALAGAFLVLPGCDSGTEPSDPDPFPAGSPQFQIQAAFDQTDVAIRVSWLSRSKNYPQAFANGSLIFPGQFHDLLSHDGVRFNRAPADQRIQEDRVNLMILDAQTAGASFANAGCYASCHTGMDSHRTISGGVIDLWHWRGGRSGPMGYAEDTGIAGTGRIRDNLGTPPSSWLRSAGDRIRENQAALQGTGHATVEGFPRFVFHKGKMMPDGFQVPRYFLWTDGGGIMVNPLQEVPAVREVAGNRTLLVAYQDHDFDPVDKVNAIDVGYLVHVASGATAHLPAHLQTAGTTLYSNWTAFWSEELGVSPQASAEAEAILAAIHAEWTEAGGNGMVARSIGFIYPSSQHDITSTSEFDTARNEWSVTLYRKLNTGDPQDVNLSGLIGQGSTFVLGLAVHDQGEGSESHDITVPYLLGSGPASDIRASSVSDVRAVNWSGIPALEERFIDRQFLQLGSPWTLETLQDRDIHQGWEFVNVIRCQACHGVDAVRIDD